MMTTTTTKYPAQVDVAVLLIFFTRTTTLTRTFAAIKQARPSHLYLYQDGPRDERDKANIEACRKIVADDQIDWQCDVQRNYHDENSGAFASNYKAQKWAFSLSDKCIVIEDDSTPAVSFFRFCKELLDRYEHDERVGMIAGFNHEEESRDVPYDYFFTSVFSIWGWASWRRVVDQWDGDYSVVDDPFNMHQLETVTREHRDRIEMLKKVRAHHRLHKPIYESVFWSCLALNSCLAIVPTRNMIANSGVNEDAAHFSSSMQTQPRRLRQLYTMKSHEVQFPLKHPRYVIENVDYKRRVSKIMAWGHPWIKVGRSLEELWLNLRHGNLAAVGKALAHRVKKLEGKDNYD